MVHQVSAGESLADIAKRYGTTIAALRHINQLESDKISIGQRLIVATQTDEMDADGFYGVRRYESWAAIAAKFKTDEATLRALNPSITQPQENQRIRIQFTNLKQLPFSRPYHSAWAQYHAAEPGESLSMIAARFAITLEQLLEFNALTEDFTVYPKLLLRVSEVMYRPDEKAIPPDLYPALYEGVDPMQLRFHTLAAGETLQQVASNYQIQLSRLLAINFLNSDASSYPGMKLWLDGQVLTDVATIPVFHTCQPNQTTRQIAEMYGFSRIELLNLNALPHNFEPYPGFVFRVSNAVKSSKRLWVPYHPKESLTSLAKRFGVEYEKLLKINALTESTTLMRGEPVFLTEKPRTSANDLELHVVAAGESLSLLAQQKRTDQQTLIELNHLKTTTLTPGQWLFLPVMPPPPLPVALKPDGIEVLSSRQSLEIQTVHGQQWMRCALRGEVGRTQRIDPEDLERVQNCLESFSLLSGDHSESPQKLKRNIGNQPITGRQIPLTIQALERFQFMVRGTRLPDNLRPMEPGLVRPGDATDFALRNLKVTRFDNKWTITNFAPHDYRAISYEGCLDISTFRGQGFTESLWDILQYAMPAKLDSVTTRPLQYGILKFADHRLAQLLTAMKQRCPIEFKAYFQRFGIDVDYHQQQGKIVSCNPRYLDLSGQGNEFEKHGIAAFEAFDEIAVVCLIRAASVRVLAVQQVFAAIEQVVWPALNLRISLQINDKTFYNIGLCETLSSHLGACALVDFAAHTSLQLAAQAMRSAFEGLAAQYKLNQPIQLRTLEINEILSYLRNSAPNKTLRERAAVLLNNRSLSDQKEAFFAFPENLFQT